MTVQEIKQLKGDITIPFPIQQVSFFKKQLFINNKVAFKVDSVSSSFQSSRDIILRNDKNEEMGVLSFTKDNTNLLDPATKHILLSALNEDQFIAYLTESTASLSYPNFTNNYVVLKREYVPEYLKEFYETAPLWGQFSHPSATITNSPYKKVINEIVAVSKLKVPKQHYYTNCIRAVQQPFAFERFLKFYHLLELSFDSLIVNKIQKLDLNSDSNKIGKLLNEYDQNEFKRLKYLLKEKCKTPSLFLNILNTLDGHEALAVNLFYVFGNDDNPIRKQNSYLEISKTKNFGNETFLKQNGISIGPDRDLNTFIIQLASYIIYRIRCSIAHNKIGEFIFQPTDEKFIVEFAEPLIVEVLKQSFKK